MQLETFSPPFNPDFRYALQAKHLTFVYKIWPEFSVKLKSGSCLVVSTKLPKRIKYSDEFNRDWLFYDSEHTPKYWYLLLSKDGNLLVVPNQQGKTAKECFWLFDSLGYIVPCREPNRLVRAYTAKFASGITIDNWLDSCGEGTLSRKEVKQYCQSMPCWMYKQFMKRL